MARYRSLSVGLTLLAMLTHGGVLSPASAASPPSRPGTAQYFQGKVEPLAKIAARHGATLDADAAPAWLALVSDDGKIYPLIKDDGARMFFKDARLLGRPVRLTGRLLPGSHLLQVVEVRSYVKGALCEVYYWCDVCHIKRFEKKDCDCCGAPLELREEPVKK